MSQPVKLSDELVLEARLAGEIVKRSIAGQVEFWATLGRSMESLLNGRQVIALSRLLETANSAAGRERVAAALERQPFPHYRPYPGKRGLLERIDADGNRTVGRFVQREFKAVRIRAKGAGAK